MSNYNKKQKEAIEFDGQHVLVIAGAGTGKTKTIVGRAAHLIKTGVPSRKIQILTFTKRAANEIVERVKAEIDGIASKELNGSTFHSWCNQLINRYPNLFGTSQYTVIDSDDQLSLMKMACGQKKELYKDLRMKPQQIIDIFSYGRNTLGTLTNSIRVKKFKGKESLQINLEIEQLRVKLESIIKLYQALKKQHRYLDYDDLLLVVSSRIRKDTQANEILSVSYDHILIDEMQDTNPLQWYLIEPFAKISKLFCVGDDAQSIYSFRGADFSNVHSFTKRLDHAEVKILDQNYRSSQEILDLSNWLLKESKIAYNKNLVAHRGRGKKPVLLSISNQFQEANYIADEILKGYSEEGKKFSDFLILSRSQYYTKPLQAIFLQKRIPYETYGGRKFLEAAHIKDLLSILRIVNNPMDQIAWMRFLTFVHGIGEVKASAILQHVLHRNVTDLNPEELSKSLPNEVRDKITTIYSTVYDNKFDVGRAIEELYKEMELDLALKYAKDWQDKRKGDIPILKMLSENYSNLGQFITEGILDNVSTNSAGPVLMGSDIKSTDRPDHVVISTVHSAKGLEADTCFVLNVSPKNYPSIHSLNDANKIEEDRRVLYVALTRAKNTLIITRTIDSINANNLSRDNSGKYQSAYFLESLPEHLITQNSSEMIASVHQDIDKPNEIDLDFGFDFR